MFVKIFHIYNGLNLINVYRIQDDGFPFGAQMLLKFLHVSSIQLNGNIAD